MESQDLHWPTQPAEEHKSVSVVVLAGAVLFVLAIVAALAWYVYYGMQHTPADRSADGVADTEVADAEEQVSVEAAAAAEQARKEQVLEDLNTTPSTLTPAEKKSRLDALVDTAN